MKLPGVVLVLYKVCQFLECVVGCNFFLLVMRFALGLVPRCDKECHIFVEVPNPSCNLCEFFDPEDQVEVVS